MHSILKKTLQTFIGTALGNKILGLLFGYKIHKIMVFEPIQAQSVFLIGQTLIYIQLVYVLTKLVIADRLSLIIHQALSQNATFTRCRILRAVMKI